MENKTHWKVKLTFSESVPETLKEKITVHKGEFPSIDFWQDSESKLVVRSITIYPGLNVVSVFVSIRR